jgi:hypothetical protein
MLLPKNRLNCFSPPVMLATFLIEFGLMIYTIARYKMNAQTRLVAALLGFLALFQLAEYNVCGGLLSLDAMTWSRIGYVAITILPPMALHLVALIAKVRTKWNVAIAAGYGAAIFWILFFGFAPTAFDGHVCAGNYAIFQISGGIGGMYFAYYYVMLLAGIGACVYLIPAAAKRVRVLLALQLTGYLSFLLPTAITNTVNPTTINGIPSIMCGFAVVYALILSLYILPRLQASKKPLKNYRPLKQARARIRR